MKGLKMVEVHTLKGHEAIGRALADNGVDTMFGLMGDANLYMVNSFVRDTGGTFVAAANEMGAALMALGFAQTSGRTGVATVTHGPGLMNTLTALVEGVKGQIPMLLLCGDTAAEDRDGLQNIPQRESIVATGAGFEQIRSLRTLTRDVGMALRRTDLERRPIALNMPIEFQWADCAYESWTYKAAAKRAFVPASDNLDDAIGIIATARRPIVLAGRGAMDEEARSMVLRLAARIDAPVATTLKAKDLFLGEDYNLGIVGTMSTEVALDEISSADCIIAFGAGLNKYTTVDGALLRGKRVIQVNQEPTEIGRFAIPTVGLVGDPKLVAEKIIHWLDEAELPPSGYRNLDLKQRLQAYKPWNGLNSKGTATTVDLRQALLWLNDAVPADRVLVTDGGRFVGEPCKLITTSGARSFVYTLDFGSIGFGVSEAIGASFGAGGRPTLLVAGDGGFMLGGLAEFNTAVRYGVDLIVAVCNDGAYGAEHIQFRRKGMDPRLTTFDWPDFAPVAEALGGQGVTIRTEADFDAAACAIQNRQGPVLIDIKLDPDRVPEPSF